MPFDLRLDFSTNDLLLDTRNDIRIIEQDNLAYQQIHNRLLIERGSYLHDKNLGSNFTEIVRHVGSDYENSVKSMVANALSGIPDVEILSVDVNRRSSSFDPLTYRPRRAKKLNTVGDFATGISGVNTGVKNALVYDTQIYRSAPGALRSVYTGQPASPPHDGHPSNLGYISVNFPKLIPSTAIVWVYIPGSWDGGNSPGSGARLTIEGFVGEYPDQENALAVSGPANHDLRDTFQPLRVEFTPADTTTAYVVLRGWNHETTPGDAPSVGSWLVSDDWEFYNTTWPEIPTEPEDELEVAISFSVTYNPDFAEGAAEFPSDVKTTSFIL